LEKFTLISSNKKERRVKVSAKGKRNDYCKGFFYIRGKLQSELGSGEKRQWGKSLRTLSLSSCRRGEGTEKKIEIVARSKNSRKTGPRTSFLKVGESPSEEQ